MPKIGLLTAAALQLSLFFSPAEKCCQVAEFCTIRKVMRCSAHPGCIHIAVRSFTDVAQLRVPQPGALYVHLLHNQATLEVSTVHTVHTDGVLSSTIPLFKSWQCSSTTPCCDTVVSYSLLFRSADSHEQPQPPWRLLRQYLHENFGSLRPCWTGCDQNTLDTVLFVQNTLDSNTDTSARPGASSIPLLSVVH